VEHLDEACRIGNGNAGRVNVAQRNGSDRALPGTRQRLRRGAELLGGDGMVMLKCFPLGKSRG
jgi:hypothetical protein